MSPCAHTLPHSRPVLVAKVDAGLLDSLGKGLLSLSDPDSGVVLLLVGLVGALWVTDLAHQVVLLVEDKVSDTGEVGELNGQHGF